MEYLLILAGLFLSFLHRVRNPEITIMRRITITNEDPIQDEKERYETPPTKRPF